MCQPRAARPGTQHESSYGNCQRSSAITVGTQESRVSEADSAATHRRTRASGCRMRVVRASMGAFATRASTSRGSLRPRRRGAQSPDGATTTTLRGVLGNRPPSPFERTWRAAAQRLTPEMPVGVPAIANSDHRGGAPTSAVRWCSATPRNQRVRKRGLDPPRVFADGEEASDEALQELARLPLRAHGLVGVGYLLGPSTYVRRRAAEAVRSRHRMGHRGSVRWTPRLAGKRNLHKPFGAQKGTRTSTGVTLLVCACFGRKMATNLMVNDGRECSQTPAGAPICHQW